MLSLIHEKMILGKRSKMLLSLIREKMFFGVNITKYQQIFRSANFFENITFWVRSVNLGHKQIWSKQMQKGQRFDLP